MQIWLWVAAISLIHLGLLYTCSAQSTWVRVFGGTGYDTPTSIACHADGSIVVVGNSRSSDGDLNVVACWSELQLGPPSRSGFALMTNGKGALTKAICLMGEAPTGANDVRFFSDGSISVCGAVTHYEQSSGWFDMYVAELSSTLLPVYTKSLGGSESDFFLKHAVTDSSVHLIGYTLSNDRDFKSMNKNSGGSFTNQVVLIKLNRKGDLLWKKTFGGSGDDIGRSLVLTPSGGMVTGGETESSDGDFEGLRRGGRSDAYVMMHNSRGEVEWKIVLGGSGDEGLFSTVISGSGDIIVSGSTSSRDGDFADRRDTSKGCVFLVCLTPSGDIRWKRYLTDFTPNDICVVQGGGIIMAGSCSPRHERWRKYGKGGSADVALMKLDSIGNELWSRVYGGRGTDYATALCEDSEGYIVVTGVTASDPGDQNNDGTFSGLGKGTPDDSIESGNDVFVLRLNRNGELESK